MAQRKAAAETVAALGAEITMCLAESRSVPEPDHLITAKQAAKKLGIALRMYRREHFGCELDGLHDLAPDGADSEPM